MGVNRALTAAVPRVSGQSLGMWFYSFTARSLTACMSITYQVAANRASSSVIDRSLAYNITDSSNVLVFRRG